MCYPYEIEMKIGQILGREKSCLGKYKYKTTLAAQEAQKRHNRDKHMNHKVRYYNCFFCGDYHVGGAFHPDDIRTLFKHCLSKDVQECYLPLIAEYEQYLKTERIK